MKNTILILGGSGFIGQNLILKLIREKNFEITLASRSFKSPKNIKKKINFIKCDLTNFKSLIKFKNLNFDYIINLSGNIDHKNKNLTNKIHHIACKNIFNFFTKKKLKLFIQVGSSLEYGNANSPQTENSKCKPVSYYGKAKFLASKFIQKSARKKKINYLILRLYQVYGPYQKFDRLLPLVIKNSLLGKKFKCSDGEQLRDFLHINDLTNLFIKILKKTRIRSGIYNVGFGKATKVKTVIKKVQNKIKKGEPLFGAIQMRSDEITNLFPNISKVKKNFKWKPKVSLSRGLSNTINYYEKKK